LLHISCAVFFKQEEKVSEILDYAHMNAEKEVIKKINGESPGFGTLVEK